MLNENGDKQSQNTHVEVNIFATQNSNGRSTCRVWIVQNNLHIAETKGTCSKLDGNFAPEMKLRRSFY